MDYAVLSRQVVLVVRAIYSQNGDPVLHAADYHILPEMTASSTLSFGHVIFSIASVEARAEQLMIDGSLRSGAFASFGASESDSSAVHRLILAGIVASCRSGWLHRTAFVLSGF